MLRRLLISTIICIAAITIAAGVGAALAQSPPANQQPVLLCTTQTFAMQLNCGRSAFTAKDYKRAQDHFRAAQKAAADQKQQSTAAYHLATAIYNTGAKAEAKGHAETAVRLDPKNGFAQELLTRISGELSKAAEAAAASKAAVPVAKPPQVAKTATAPTKPAAVKTAAVAPPAKVTEPPAKAPGPSAPSAAPVVATPVATVPATPQPAPAARTAQELFVEGAKHEAASRNEAAMRVYTEIMDRFPTEPVAVDAGRRLLVLRDAERAGAQPKAPATVATIAAPPVAPAPQPPATPTPVASPLPQMPPTPVAAATASPPPAAETVAPKSDARVPATAIAAATPAPAAAAPAKRQKDWHLLNTKGSPHRCERSTMKAGNYALTPYFAKQVGFDVTELTNVARGVFLIRWEPTETMIVMGDSADACEAMRQSMADKSKK